MSMRGSGGEENCLDASSGVEVRVTQDVSRHSTSPGPAVTAQKCFVSPLLRIFSSKEVVPRILEYEKALLVMKEHDYAKAPERPEVLKLSSLLVEPPLLCEDSRESVDAIGDMHTLMNTRKDLLQFRENSSKDSVVSSHLRDMVGMQIELIREQQEQLHAKDKELNTVRKDKEQLQARLERMERRLAISQKHSRSKYDPSESDSPHQQNTSLENSPLMDTSSTPRIRPHRGTHRDSVASAEKYSRSRSNSHDRVGRTSRSSRVSNSGTPTPQDPPDSVCGGSVKRNAKRKLSDNIGGGETLKKKKVKQAETRTRLQYTGLNLPVPPQHDNGCAVLTAFANHDESRRNSSDLGGSVGSVCSGNGERMSNGTAMDTILVPSWRTFMVRESMDDATECEDLSDGVFTRRHRKPEEEEKRRKRWDMQRARAQRNHEELLRKYNQKGGGGEKPEKKKEKIVTFMPKFSEVESIEIKDTLTVTAFGMPVPLIKPKDFEVPWCDLDAREAKESKRTTRSRTKSSTNRLSVGSSADEDFK